MRPTEPKDYRFHPMVGHWDANIVLNNDGSWMAVFQLSGLAAELAGARAVVQAVAQDVYMLNAFADPRFEWWDHFVRSEDTGQIRLPQIPNWFADRYDRIYHTTQVSGIRYANELFVTLVMHPNYSVRQSLLSWFGRDKRAPEEVDVQEFKIIIQQTHEALARYGCRLLGLREHEGRLFSEVAEAFYRIANGRFAPVGLSRNRLGRFVTPDRIIFGHSDLHVLQAGGGRFCSVLTFHDYPPNAAPVMFAPLRTLPFPVVITSASRFQYQPDARDSVAKRAKRMQSSEDLAEGQIEELKRDVSAVAGNLETFVHHHWSVAVHASSLQDLDTNVAKVQSLLNNVGIKSTRESVALKSAHYAQIPGCRRWRTRPGQVKLADIAAFGAKHGVLRGEERGRWGAPIIVLNTTANTNYNFHYHVQGVASMTGEDLGHTLIIGPSTSGKTSLMASLCLLSLRNPDTRILAIDKDYGLAVAVRAAHGSYMELYLGRDTGLNPLKALSDTPEDKAFLRRFTVAYMINTPDEVSIVLTPDEDAMLDKAIALQMRMPPELREWSNIVTMMGQRNQFGAGARLRRWCRGGSLGWVLDCERDELDMAPRIVGVETGQLLKDKTVSAPILAYLSYRQDALINGKPFVKAIDEMWKLDRIDSAREETNDLLKTLRKQEGVVILATQSAKDALESPIAHTFQQQIPNKIFFGDGSASYDHLVNGMGLTHAEFLAVTTQLPNMRHTFLLKRPSGSVLCRFDLSAMREQLAVVSARKSTFDLMNHLRAIHGPEPEQWVPHFERQAPRLAADPSYIHAEAAE